jgi:hypothetical protein
VRGISFDEKANPKTKLLPRQSRRFSAAYGECLRMERRQKSGVRSSAFVKASAYTKDRDSAMAGGLQAMATRLQEEHPQRFFRGAGVGLFDPPKTCFKLCPSLSKADGVGVAFGLEECVRAFI